MTDQFQGCREAVKRFDWLEPFVPHPLCPGGWLQTASIKFLRPSLDVMAWEGMVPIDVSDDQDPPDRMTGFYLPSKDADSSKPTSILFHGMGGHAESGYMRSIAASLLSGGYPVILWNHRGAGNSGPTCRGLHHPGSFDDITHLVRHLELHCSQWLGSGLTAVAFSLGANRLLRYLSQTGKDSHFLAAVTVSAPLDLKMTSSNLRHGLNKLFDRFLLKRQRDEMLRPAADLTASERTAIRNASSVWELDDWFTGPHFGYAGAEAYYESASAIHILDRIQVPTLLFHALDDPVVDSRIFAQHEWEAGGPLFPALARSGGHTGFLERQGKRWHERHTVRFFDYVVA